MIIKYEVNLEGNTFFRTMEKCNSYCIDIGDVGSIW